MSITSRIPRVACPCWPPPSNRHPSAGRRPRRRRRAPSPAPATFSPPPRRRPPRRRCSTATCRTARTRRRSTAKGYSTSDRTETSTRETSSTQRRRRSAHAARASLSADGDSHPLELWVDEDAALPRFVRRHVQPLGFRRRLGRRRRPGRRPGRRHAQESTLELHVGRFAAVRGELNRRRESAVGRMNHDDDDP